MNLHYKDQMVNAALRNNHCLFYKKNTAIWNMMLCVYIHCGPIIMSLSTKPVTKTLLHRKPAFTGNLKVHFSPAVQFTSFHRTALKCWTPASKQASHLLKIFPDTCWTSRLYNINTLWSNITLKLMQNNADFPHNLYLSVSATNNNRMY